MPRQHRVVHYKGLTLLEDYHRRKLIWLIVKNYKSNKNLGNMVGSYQGTLANAKAYIDRSF